ncbi:MAG: DUF1330 domain-containing protein [Proteobacteria bacterium]|nr:DUF1330 domain-containing protein [Pseudomonadota bacterium]
MAAYIIASIDVADAVGYEEYRQRVPPLIAAFGGRFLVRGGPIERLEGEEPPGRIVVLEFPDRASARAFYECPEYQTLVRIRQRHSRGSLWLVDGVPPVAAREPA